MNEVYLQSENIYFLFQMKRLSNKKYF